MTLAQRLAPYTFRETLLRPVKTPYYDMIEVEFHWTSGRSWIAELRRAA